DSFGDPADALGRRTRRAPRPGSEEPATRPSPARRTRSTRQTAGAARPRPAAVPIGAPMSRSTPLRPARLAASAVAASALVALGFAAPQTASAQPAEPAGGAAAPGDLVWSDEFDGAAGSAPDPANWNHELGDHGWGNGELQNYTDSRENSALDGD